MQNFSRWDVQTPANLNLDSLDDADWHRVVDETGAAGSLLVRVAKSSDGKLVITGLVMGDGIDEVTGQALRAIKPGEIIRTIQWRESGTLPPRSVGALGPTGLARFEGMTERVESHAEASAAPSKRGRRGPTHEELTRFAEVYTKHSTYSDAAMTLAARELGLSRATANRWAARCRNEGLLNLEPREDDQ
ncbi:leucine zipper domain-containing protein [Demequina activiva]|uniref:Uncharacterized protein n=1 Tax=Demequina activiva TaxID=1582364 RepID=A0A919Q2R5_9MICO|nr:leucine zipper domain-containing protein [Demequina activiva]GIG54539.1 hypothetical protein Dac01nite_12910 [Demequina activiva]